jgi:hypothetical protein
VVTPDVLAEIVLPDQKQQVDGAVAVGIFRIEELSGPETIGAVCRTAALHWRGRSGRLRSPSI